MPQMCPIIDAQIIRGKSTTANTLKRETRKKGGSRPSAGEHLKEGQELHAAVLATVMALGECYLKAGKTWLMMQYIYHAAVAITRLGIVNGRTDDGRKEVLLACLLSCV